MKTRIDEIENLKKWCTGCLACVDACPKSCIKPITNEDGFRYIKIDDDACVRCGRCLSVCPAENQKKNTGGQHLYAAYAKDDYVRNGGSSGGIFELLARHFLKEGYLVCGASFDGTQLHHRIISSEDELPSLLKSKYVQSDTKNIYHEILSLLKDGHKVFYCGTPCQVSALKNIVPSNMQGQLFTADIICHGVPSQKTFDMYLNSLGKKKGGEVISFSFRVKDNKHRHAHGYSYVLKKGDKEETINGIYLQSSFYTGFKRYLFFRESCYDCRYATIQRVSDITLGDFWGIEKYNPKLNSDKGVSMVIANTDLGKRAFESLSLEAFYQELPVQYGMESNYCLTHSTKKPKDRDAVVESLVSKGYEQTAKQYFDCSFLERVYAKLPPSIRDLRKKIRKG